jgi:mono/diheme cytochrome c family protein
MKAVLALISLFALGLSARYVLAQESSSTPAALAASFEEIAKPFLQKNCQRCHNVDMAISGVKVDQLNGALEDRHLGLWAGIRHKISDESMPPKGQPQPSAEERKQIVDWITRALEVARSRPAPKNGLVRRLTVAQYRNTLRQLLLLDDDLTEAVPPDAVSRDGFVNNKDTLHLSPLLLEAYLDVAEEGLSRAIVDPKAKPSIQNFRVELGASVNPKPFPDPLILGANSLLLDNKDFVVTEPAPVKPFAFEPFRMQTKFRFIEGYAGNDTVRGWREYDSIYHAVFACMRGSMGYPKGKAYGTVPGGLLLRPAIPNDELFDAEGTYGPKANFKISLRELPDQGRFRVTVMAAKYNDGLLLDPGAAPHDGVGSVVARSPATAQTVPIPKAGLYQIDVHEAPRRTNSIPPDLSRLGESAPLAAGALSLKADTDAPAIARTEAMNVGDGEFTVAAWIHPKQLRRAGIVSLGSHGWTHGWYLEMPNDKGVLRIETAGQDTQSNGSVSSPPGVILPDAWQHVAAVVRRGKKETRLYVNGYAVAKGEIGPANLDNPNMKLQIGRIGTAPAFLGDLEDVRIFRRALSEAELQGLLEPKRQFVKPPPEKPQDVTVKLGEREFSGTLLQPAFVIVRLEAGPLRVQADRSGVRDLDRIAFTPLAPTDDAAKRFLAFEKRSPRLGVHLGLRRDCGSTLAPVGPPQTVAGTQLARYVFEGAIRNFPSPDVEKDNVNYLAGVREIGVRSEYTDGRDMPRLLIRSVEFEGPLYDTWPPASHKSIFIDSDARRVIRSFATRAYRRPVTSAEEAPLMSTYEKSFSAKGDFRQSVKDALQVVLTSPQFLFLIEKSSTPQPERLDDYELSSKLSYFLWNGPPDRTTLRLASTGTLRKQLDAEVTRMISDARFAEFVREFTSQWLALDKFAVLEPDREKFPRLTRDVRAQLKQEPVQFLHHLIRNNLPVRNLIDSDFVIANEVVAGYYDLGEKTDAGFRFVAIPHQRRELGGVLTEAALLAGLSDGRESNPVKRGAWLARKIIAEPPDDPPPNVPALKEETKNLTLRERIEQHRNQQGCRQCHAKIDPWGIALEEFDAGGRLKAQPVDARSQLPDGTEVSSVNDLKRYLTQDRIDQVAFSVLKHLTTYATGRTLTYNELGYLKQDGLKLRAGGYRMQDMIRYVVNSRMFLEK